MPEAVVRLEPGKRIVESARCSGGTESSAAPTITPKLFNAECSRLRRSRTARRSNERHRCVHEAVLAGLQVCIGPHLPDIIDVIRSVLRRQGS